MDAALSTQLSLAQATPIAAPARSLNYTAAHKAATEFEGVILGQFLGQMFEGIPTDGPFGGGEGEGMFRSLMVDQYGKQLAARGGLGLSDAITRTLLAQQEDTSVPTGGPSGAPIGAPASGPTPAPDPAPTPAPAQSRTAQ